MCAYTWKKEYTMADFIISAFADEASHNMSEQIAILQKHKLSHIELRNVNGKNIVALTDDEAETLAKQLKEGGISVSAIGSPVGKMKLDEFETDFAKFKRAVAIAKIVGTTRIRMFSYFTPQDENTDNYHEQVIDNIRKLCVYGKEHGVDCYHENEKGIYGDIYQRTVKIQEELKEDIKCIFDPANSIQCKENAYEAYTAMSKYVDYLHIKDALDDGRVVPAGKGDGEIAKIIRHFRDSNKDKTPLVLTLEPHLTIFEGLANLQYEEIKHKYEYENATVAFDVAVEALKEIIEDEGFTYE